MLPFEFFSLNFEGDKYYCPLGRFFKGTILIAVWDWHKIGAAWLKPWGLFTQNQNHQVFILDGFHSISIHFSVLFVYMILKRHFVPKQVIPK